MALTRATWKYFVNGCLKIEGELRNSPMVKRVMVRGKDGDMVNF
jgi:hypothetical protein